MSDFFVLDSSGLHEENFKAFCDRGRVLDCTCGMIECVCTEARKHKDGCRTKIALLCPIGFECKHGFDVCPECDLCTC